MLLTSPSHGGDNVIDFTHVSKRYLGIPKARDNSENKRQNKARLDNPHQPAVPSAFIGSSNINDRFDARPRW